MPKARNVPTSKKSAEMAVAPAPVRKTKSIVPKELNEKSGEELVIENFAAVSNLVETLGETIELLTQKVENMAYHIIATEELLAELIAENGISLAQVNTRIRHKISVGTENSCDPARAIDIAAAIASPLPRR